MLVHAVRSALVAVTLLLALSGTPSAAEAGSADLLTQADAQRLVDDVSRRVAETRGLAFKHPVPVHVVGDEQMRRHMLQRLELFGVETQLERTGKVYELLGLVPEGTRIVDLLLDTLEEQVGGYYDPGQGAYFLMDDVPRAVAPVFTAHELTHALEDQHFDLDKRLRAVMDDDDRALAQGAVNEGTATVLMSVYMIGAMARGEMSMGDLQQLASTEAGRAEKLAALPDVLARQLVGPYVLGAAFLTRGNLLALAQGFPVESANRVMQDRPASTEQILHPEKYWDEEQRDDPRRVRIKGVGKVLGRGWQRAAEGSLGELILGPLVGAPTTIATGLGGVPSLESWTNDAASGWDGDRWQLWQREDASVAVVSTVWDTPADALEFAEALPEREGLRWRSAGARVAIVAGEGGDAADRLLERLLR